MRTHIPNKEIHMVKQVLTRAHRELFRRPADQSFNHFNDLYGHCRQMDQESKERWVQPGEMAVVASAGTLGIEISRQQTFGLNNWSFGQLCTFAGVSRDTVNRLTPDTASLVFEETLPSGNKPVQVYEHHEAIRSIHPASYTRLTNIELLSTIREFATDFIPPQRAGRGEPTDNGGTGLYCGEQDLFVFLIDPTGWIEIEDEAFCPGMFVWNSEVGRRSVGIQTFWFQAICANHIVWDATEVVEFSRKHTANVRDALSDIRQIMHRLVLKRDSRRDMFAQVIRKAMQAHLGSDDEEALKLLSRHDIPKAVAKEALDIARRDGRLTIFSVVDALTRLAGSIPNAGDRTELDTKASSLLALAR
jgi:hypothetical protein